ncbi:hypothetical protein [Carnimonas bestiolae]|uniref:hypothetical protein n=1 Tax=Carnimonas bestiolae TaxID=3402172 RepID=UPI003F4ACE31
MLWRREHFLPSCLPAFLPSCLPAFLPSCLPAFLPSCLSADLPSSPPAAKTVFIAADILSLGLSGEENGWQ